MEDFYFKIVCCFVASFERDTYDVIYQNSKMFLMASETKDTLFCALFIYGLGCVK